jgi:putative nucleotidyltransferase with HDIG domain
MTADLEQHVRSTFAGALAEIGDDGLREQVVATWVRAMQLGGATDLASDIPPLKKLAKRPDCKPGLGLDHVQAVIRFAIAIADAEPQAHGLRPDRDVVVAGALLHDVGKLLERAEPGSHPLAGTKIRHAVSGVHLAMLEGVPTPVMHVIAYHAAEGHRVHRSLECHIVYVADELAVDAIERRELGESDLEPYVFVPA